MELRGIDIGHVRRSEGSKVIQTMVYALWLVGRDGLVSGCTIQTGLAVKKSMKIASAT